MKRRDIFLGAAALLALTACAPMPTTSPLSAETTRTLRIANFAVATEQGLFDSAAARERRATLPADLGGALRREFSDRLGSDGWTMQVEVTRMTLASSTETAFGRDQSRLEGVVRLIDPAGVARASYIVQTTAGEAAETTTGALASAAVNTQGGFYRDLLGAFARSARTQILGRDLPGERAVRAVQRQL
ncbi:MAG: hypothetical protein ACU0CI_04485 [Shimia sp.]